MRTVLSMLAEANQLPGRGAKSFLLVMGGFRAAAAGRGR